MTGISQERQPSSSSLIVSIPREEKLRRTFTLAEEANAMEDALASHGVTVRTLPITPEQVWRWLERVP